MHRKRIIVCLTIAGGQLVKTIRFENPTYIGDPMNTVRIFDRKRVDELILLDITATREGREIDYSVIEKIAEETMFPFAYGGGIHSYTQAVQLFRIGIEKVVLCSAVTQGMDLISRVSSVYGSQSTVVCINARRERWPRSGYYVRGRASMSPVEFAREAVRYGAGEIIIQSVDQDGMMQGYDVELTRQVASFVDVPVVALGGAWTYRDVEDIFNRTEVSAAAASSMFIFQNRETKGVLINYPTIQERIEISDSHS